MEPIIIAGEQPELETNPSKHPAFLKAYPKLFAPLQTEGYRRVMERRSCALVAPTSSGKTLAVAAPLFEDGRPVVFVLPFRALIKDLSNELPRIARLFDISEERFAIVQGGTTDEELAKAMRCDYMLMTPDKLVSLFVESRKHNAAALSILLKYDFVFDEVHVYNSMMQTSLMYFLRSVRYWQELRPRKSAFYFLSATFPPEFWRMLQCEMGFTDADKIEGKSYTGNVRLLIKPSKTVTDTTTGEIPIVEDMKSLGMESDVVGIFNTAYRAYKVYKNLERGLLFIGQDKMSEIDRKRNFDCFMDFPEEYALIGSPAIEAGVDFTARNLVIEESYQDSFVQRFGRAARSGRDATVLAYSDTLYKLHQRGQLASTYTRPEFLELLRMQVERRESRKIFSGLAAYVYYNFWNKDPNFPLDSEDLTICQRLEKKEVNPGDLLAFRGLVPFTYYQTGESISFKTLFRRNLKVDPQTRIVMGSPNPCIYYEHTHKRKPVPARVNKIAWFKTEGESSIMLVKVGFELVQNHHWSYWVLLELTKAHEWDNEDDNISLEIDGNIYRPSDGRPGEMLVRFYNVDD